MNRASAILPDREGARGFVVLVSAALIFLASLAISGALALENTARSWRGALAGALTIELPASAREGAAEQIRQAVAALRGTAGVVSVKVVRQEKVLELLEPWIGKSSLASQLPIPVLIDVRLDKDRPADIAYLERRLKQVVPNAVVDGHEVWLARLKRFTDGLFWLALTVVAAIILLVVVVIAFSARVSLSAHRDIVEILNLIGAHDGFIAAHFQRRAFRRVLQGAVIGIVLAIGAYVGIAMVFDQVQAAMISNPGLLMLQLACLSLLGPLTAGIAALTSRLAVLRALRKIL